MAMIDTKKCFEAAVLAAKNGKPVNEDVGDWMLKKLRDTKRKMLPPGTEGKLFNRQTAILDAIRNGKYDDAIAKAKDNGVTDKTLFDQVVLFGREKYLGLGRFFGKRYYRIPFLFAGVAAAIDGVEGTANIAKYAVAAFRRIFIEGGLGSGTSLNIKAEESTRFSDFCSFMLTHDGTLPMPEPAKRTDEVDFALVEMFRNLIDLGWKPGNVAQSAPGLLVFILSGDFVASLKFLAANRCLTPSKRLIGTFNVPDGTLCHEWLSKSEPQDFQLGGNDVTRVNGSIVGGDFHDKMLSLGYDIKSKDVQPLPFTMFFVLAQELSLIYNRYAQQGYKFTSKGVSLFTAKNISAATAQITAIMKGYTNLCSDPSFKAATDEQKNVMVQQYIARIMSVVGGLESEANASLSALGLPPISFQFNTKLDPNSKRLWLDMGKFNAELKRAVALSKSAF